MEILEVGLILIATVLVSSVFDQLLTRVSLPLVQMAMGVLLAVAIPADIDATLPSELFLVLFIAPLLFDESKRVSKKHLLSQMSGILSLAIALVVAMFAVGFTVHLIEPSIPLAAALALGAALGPTDAVAVTSLSSTLKLSSRQKALLSGEALINDASGIVTFQFAVAAVVTGSFSLADASSSFARTFFGGLVVGLLFALAVRALMSLVSRIGLDSTTFHVVFDVTIPFAVFLLGEALHVSGIIAVVAAGLALTWLPERGQAIDPSSLAVADGVWETFSFVLNGIVFVLLGAQLPSVILPKWQGIASVASLSLLIFAATAVIIAVRFVWLVGMEISHRAAQRRIGRDNQPWAQALRDVLVTTLAGPKGAVTLSIIFTLPYLTNAGESFPHRADLIFIASGVIVITLLLANFVIPLLAEPADEEDPEMAAARALVYKHVVGELSKMQRKDGDLATAVITRDYETRLAELDAEMADLDSHDRTIRQLRREMLEHQRRYLADLVAKGEIDPATARQCRSELKYSYGRSLRRNVERHSGNPLKPSREYRTPKHALRTALAFARRRAQPHEIADLFSEERLQSLRSKMWRDTSEYLRNIAESDDAARASAAQHLIDERHATLELFKEIGSDTSIERMRVFKAPDMRMLKARQYEVESAALRAEREAIDKLHATRAITREQSLALREEVYKREVTLNSGTMRRIL